MTQKCPIIQISEKYNCLNYVQSMHMSICVYAWDYIVYLAGYMAEVNSNYLWVVKLSIFHYTWLYYIISHYTL